MYDRSEVGKFNSAADEYVYELSLDGRAETVGSVQFAGHAARIELSQEESTHLRTLYSSSRPILAVIVCEDSQGFVDTEFFLSIEDTEGMWGHYLRTLDVAEDI